MANVVYPNFKEHLLSGNAINLVTGVVKIALIRTSASPYDAADTTLADLAGGYVALTSALTGKSVTDGQFDATGGGVASSVAAGAAIDAIAYVLEESASDAGRRLLAWKDTGFSPSTITPNGSDITMSNGGTGFTL